MVNILIANKNKDYILTEFYYPAISKRLENNTRYFSSLRPQTNILENKLKKIQKVTKVNVIQLLTRSNSINFILKKKDVDQLYNLSDTSIIDLFFDRYLFPELFLLAKQSMDEPEADFFLHTKDMYLDSHKEKTLKLLKTKDHASLNYMYNGREIIQSLTALQKKKFKMKESLTALQKKKFKMKESLTDNKLKKPTISVEDNANEYDRDSYKFFLLRSMRSCSIKRKTKSIEFDCKKYPLKIINQNIEINFYY